MNSPADKLPPEAELQESEQSPARRPRSFLRRLYVPMLRGLWYLALLLLVPVATYLTAGRLLMPMLAGQIEGIETRLSDTLGVTITIAGLEGSWFRFSPSLEVSGLGIRAGTDEAALSLGLGRAFMTMDVPASLLQRELVISRVNLAGLALVLRETAGGTWTLAGLGGGGADFTPQLLQFLLETRDISLSEASLQLQFQDGSEHLVGSIYAELQNNGDRHDLQLQFRLDGQVSPSRVLVEIEGDPRAEFAARVYAAASELNLQPFARQSGPWQLQQFGVGGRLWLALDNTGLRTVTASIADMSVIAGNPDMDGRIELENAAFTLRGDRTLPVDIEVSPASGVWDIQVVDLAFDLQQRPWELPALQVRVPLDPAGTLKASAAELELAMVAQLLTALLPQESDLANVLDTLAPRGSLHNVVLQTARDGTFPELFNLRANLEQVAVNAWNAAPAGSGLDGYLQVGARAGFAEVDSTGASLHLPRLFSAPWQYDRLNTRVSWQYGDGELRVNSTAIEVANSGLQGAVQFELHNTRDADGELSSQLALLVGMERMDVASGRLYLPDLDRMRDTMQWLEMALQGGELKDSGFLLRMSTLADAPPDSATFATWYHIADGSIRYLPDWPMVEGISGSVLVHDGLVDVQTSRARTAGVALEPVRATLRPDGAGGNLLRVDGTALGSTADGLAFLRNTPVRDATGPFMDDWEANGTVRAEIALEIPLGTDSPGERSVAVSVQSTDSELSLPGHALTLSGINGLVTYQSDAGLAARELQAILLDSPIQVGIETLTGTSGSRTTRITGVGNATVASLQGWDGLPAFVHKLLGFADGTLGYRATLDVSAADAAGVARSRLELQSSLAGLTSRLPAPLGKSADEQRELQLQLDFLPGEETLGLRYDDQLAGQLVLDDQGIDRGQLYLGERNRDFAIRQSDADAPGLLVNGELPYFSYTEWQEVAEVLAEDDQGGRPLAEYLRLVDLDVGVLAVGELTVDDINVQAEFLPEGLQVRGNSALVAGRMTQPGNGNAPWQVELDYLRFPPRPEPDPAVSEPEEPEDMLADVDPTSLPDFDFSVAELSIGEDNLGTFSFRLRSGSGGASIADFRMQAPDAGISDIAQTGGANIDWRYRQGRHASSFNGLFTAGNLARVLPQWGQDGNIESERARFSGTLQWEGSPLAFALKSSSGQILMDIRSGRFVDIQSNSSRLVGALNFDSLVRRLQLDFSDLFQRGFAFDRISGNLNFDEGVVTPNGGLLIEGPSSRITINGKIDLSARTIAADMLVRIPLGQNISMLAGILGAWPIALSTYLASKIFQEQVEDFATVIYRLEGPWDNPRAGFEAPQPATDAQDP